MSIRDIQGFPPIGVILPNIVNGRLTLTSGTPITTTDVSAATTLYFTPYMGNYIRLWDGRVWDYYAFDEVSIAIPGALDSNYDVFGFLNGGKLALELVIWSDGITRATSLVLKDGAYVKNGEPNKLYLGTIRTTSAGQGEDSISKRFVWNYYNRAERKLLVTDGTNNWTYATASYRQYNNTNANRVEFVIGMNERPVFLHFITDCRSNGAAVGVVGIGLDSTTTNNAELMNPFGAVASVRGAAMATYRGYPGAGYHFLQLLEWASAATITFFGDAGTTVVQSGASGFLHG